MVKLVILANKSVVETLHCKSNSFNKRSNASELRFTACWFDFFALT